MKLKLVQLLGRPASAAHQANRVEKTENQSKNNVLYYNATKSIYVTFRRYIFNEIRSNNINFFFNRASTSSLIALRSSHSGSGRVVRGVATAERCKSLVCCGQK